RMAEQLSDRERQILEAVIRAYVETAEAAGSRTIARRYELGVSPATVRNTMADLEEKGFLFHTHTSAGRIPTDRAYRYFVDDMMRPLPLSEPEQRRLAEELAQGDANPLEQLLRRAAHALGLVTGELGLVVSPRLDRTVLERLELVGLSSDKVLLVLTLGKGVVRTIYVDLPSSVPAETLAAVSVVLNERLAGHTLAAIRETLPDRLRDTTTGGNPAGELLNIFLQSASELFDPTHLTREDLMLGRTSVLANQPEFNDEARLRNLIELTEERDLLSAVLADREVGPRLHVTIGSEHASPRLTDFTLVTSSYRIGGTSGIIGVIGPTRMPYEKIASIVTSASALMSQVLGDAGRQTDA
ncbi:MAG TPA: heat-inducible transcriptional repressor HrcA, partial [Longimicrobiales bacterium]|nr:heat-inducible transcriptional repressor HrcA [Longimicrobiales bacterium]